VPVDLDPGDCRLEVGIILLHPYNIQDMPTPQQTEILEIIYSRIGFEIVNPDMSAGVFQIDDKLYHLIRIPYTGTHW
jgi:phage tail sheath gpL-like